MRRCLLLARLLAVAGICPRRRNVAVHLRRGGPLQGDHLDAGGVSSDPTGPGRQGRIDSHATQDTYRAGETSAAYAQGFGGSHQMTVIVAHDTPDAIRGMLKRWFIEP